jgi:hypothetical protein
MDEKRKEEYQQGMFAGATFNNSVVVGVAESGSVVCYHNPEEEKKQEIVPASKEAVLEYVRRLMPVVKEKYRNDYDSFWTGILELDAVKVKIYNKGKQKDTTFNRNLLAQMIHQVSKVLYVPTANTVEMSEYLEPQKGVDHPVRQKLGESPEKSIKNAIEDYLKEYI